MKKRNWAAAIVVIVMGLLCMAFSASSLSGNSVLGFGFTFMQLSFWMVVPIVVLIGAYFLLLKNRHK